MAGGRTRRLLARAVAVVGLSLGAIGLTAAPAHAWYWGGVWLNFGHWNCPHGGSVKGISFAIDDADFTRGIDWGDNVVYLGARIDTRNTGNGRVWCSRPWYRGGGYWNNSVWKQFWPNRSGQGIWL